MTRHAPLNTRQWFGPDLGMRLTDDWHNVWLPRFRDRQWWIQMASHPIGVIAIWCVHSTDNYD